MSELDRRSGVDVPSAVMGFGLAMFGFSAIWMVQSGIRVDEQGTSFTTFELWGLWGGLACGAVLTLCGALLAARPRG